MYIYLDRYRKGKNINPSPSVNDLFYLNTVWITIVGLL